MSIPLSEAIFLARGVILISSLWSISILFSSWTLSLILSFEDSKITDAWDVSIKQTISKRILIIDDINDSGETFNIVKKIFIKSNCEIRFAALINNISSKIKIDYHGQLIDKKDNPVWYVFPWEDWW